MTDRCETHRRALDRRADGEAAPDPSAPGTEARTHAASCPGCAAAEGIRDAVGRRLRERAGPPVLSGEDAAPVAGLREAVLARIGRTAAVLDLRPFLRRTAAAAAVLLVLSTAAALWQGRRAATPDRPALDREDILAALVKPRLEPRR